MLEWRRPLATAAGGAGLPGPLIGAAESIVSWRTGVDLADEDQLAHADQLRVPILLLHGTADRVIPLADSRALRSALPGEVHLVQFAGAGHVDSWHSDPARYETAVRRFLLATETNAGRM